MNRLQQLYEVEGQSPWLDNLRRGYVTSGQLAALVADGVRGLTSNPSIFQKAMEGSADYDEQLGDLGRVLDPPQRGIRGPSTQVPAVGAQGVDRRPLLDLQVGQPRAGGPLHLARRRGIHSGPREVSEERSGGELRGV